MSTVVFDFGNARGKWLNAKSMEHGDFEHAIAPLTEDQWGRVAGRGKPPKGYIKVNGKPYAVGTTAKRHTISRRPEGAGRYTDTYYAPACLNALVESVGQSSKVVLYASHAPQDLSYAQDIVTIMQQEWEVECFYGTLHFSIGRVETFDEPLGGYAHYVFNADGTEKKKNPVSQKTALLLDVGGYTTDQVAIDPGGIIDIGSLRSTRAGVIAALDQFTNDLRAHHRELFRNVGDLDIRRVEDGIIKGVYPFGNQPIPCQEEATEAITKLVNEVILIINSAGGAANYDVILLTGGGSALIYNALCAAFPYINFIKVESSDSLMKYANVFGGAKIAALMKQVKA